MLFKRMSDNLVRAKIIRCFAPSLDDPELIARAMEMFGAPEGAGTDPGQPMPAAPAAEAAPAADAAEAAPAADAAPAAEAAPADAPPPEGQPAPPAPAQGKLLGKFASVDDLANAYVNLERSNTQARQELSAVKKALDGQPTTSSTLGPDQADSPDTDLMNDPEALAELQYTDPVKFAQMLKDQAKAEIEAEIAPLREKYQQEQRQAQWREKVDDFTARTPDVERWIPVIRDVLQHNPELEDDPLGMDKAYLMAKGMNYQEAPDPEQLLQDDDFIREKVLRNDKVRSAVVQDYLAQLKKGAPPASIGTGPAKGDVPITPAKQPLSMADAEAMAMELFSK